MKSLEELVEEFKRDVLGQEDPPAKTTEQPAHPPAPEPDVTTRADRPVSEEDFEFDLDVSLQAPPDMGPATTRAWAPGGPSVNLLRGSAPVVPEVPAPTPLPEEEPVERSLAGKAGARQPRTGPRRSLALALVVLLGGGALVGVTMLRDRSSVRNDDLQSVAPLPQQDVVTWGVSDPEDPDVAYVTAVANGGDRDPVALGIPGYTVVTGYDVSTVGDAAAQDAGLMAAAVENLIGVRVDASEGSTLEDVAGLVDRVGGIEADDRTMTGAEALRYLADGNDGESSGEFRFLRWLELVEGILGASAGREEVLAEILEPETAAVLAAAGAGGAEVLELPVTDVGSGLARTDPESTEALVADLFVRTWETGRVVRLVVLNGVGTPGVVERVSRILVPSGFQLVSSQDAPRLDVGETQIIATDEGFLAEADLARRLLGVGTVYLGEQPTRVADVTVIIGRDLGGQ